MGPGTLSGFRKPLILEPKERLDWQSGVVWAPAWRPDFSIAFLKTSDSHRSPGVSLQPADMVIECSLRHQPACFTPDAAPHSGWHMPRPPQHLCAGICSPFYGNSIYIRLLFSESNQPKQIKCLELRLVRDTFSSHSCCCVCCYESCLPYGNVVTGITPKHTRTI